jgi:hypothetical protein
MTYLRKYTREQLIALARQRGIYAPENATDEELKVVERRLSTERGWIGGPQPAREWHESHYSRMADRIAARQAREIRDAEQEAHDAARDWPDGPPLRIADPYVAGRLRCRPGDADG